MSVAVRLLPFDQLSSGVCGVIPSPYRSPMIRPRHVTTNAAVMPAGGSKAASTAWATSAASSTGGSGSSVNTSPIGHGIEAGSGSALATGTGVKRTALSPSGSATHPCPPTYCAVRVTPLARVRWTALALAVDHALDDVPALAVRAGEEADVRGGEVRVEPGDEDGRAERLGEPGGVVQERVAGRRDVVGVELELGGACGQRLGLRGRRRCQDRRRQPGRQDERSRPQAAGRRPPHAPAGHAG